LSIFLYQDRRPPHLARIDFAVRLVVKKVSVF